MTIELSVVGLHVLHLRPGARRDHRCSDTFLVCDTRARGLSERIVHRFFTGDRRC
jgi:hypothetical protein